MVQSVDLFNVRFFVVVSMTGENFWISSLFLSEIYTLPSESTATCSGSWNWPSSLPKDPPNFVIKLPSLSNFNTLGCWLHPGSDCGSVTYTLSYLSKAICSMWQNW